MKAKRISWTLWIASDPGVGELSNSNKPQPGTTIRSLINIQVYSFNSPTTGRVLCFSDLLRTSEEIMFSRTSAPFDRSLYYLNTVDANANPQIPK